MEAMSPPQQPQLHSPLATNTAYGRIDALLRAYGINHSAVRARYCLEFLEEASQKVETSEANLESVAAHIAFKRIRHGVDGLITASSLPLDTIDQESFYLALQASGIPQHHPDVILGTKPASKALCERIRTVYQTQAQPTLHRISMGAPSLKFDLIDDVTQSAERFLERHPILRNLLKLTCISIALFLVYCFAR